MSSPRASGDVPQSPNISKMTVNQLKEELAKHGLEQTGKKADLIERLQKYNKELEEAANTALPAEEADELEEDKTNAEEPEENTEQKKTENGEKENEDENENEDNNKDTAGETKKEEEQVDGAEEENANNEEEEGFGPVHADEDEKLMEEGEGGEEEEVEEKDEAANGGDNEADGGDQDKDEEAMETEEADNEEGEGNVETEDLEHSGVKEEEEHEEKDEHSGGEESDNEDKGSWKRQDSKKDSDKATESDTSPGKKDKSGKKQHYPIHVVTKGDVISAFNKVRTTRRLTVYPLTMADLGRPEILENLDKCHSFMVKFCSGKPSGTTPMAGKSWFGVLVMDFSNPTEAKEAMESLKDLGEEIKLAIGTVNVPEVQQGKDDFRVDTLNRIACLRKVPNDWDEKRIQQELPDATAVVIVYDGDGSRSGEAFVQFKDMDDMVKTIHSCAGGIKNGFETIPVLPMRNKFEQLPYELKKALYPDQNIQPPKMGLLSVKAQTEIKQELRTLGKQLSDLEGKNPKKASNLKSRINQLMSKLEAHQNAKSSALKQQMKSNKKANKGGGGGNIIRTPEGGFQTKNRGRGGGFVPRGRGGGRGGRGGSQGLLGPGPLMGSGLPSGLNAILGDVSSGNANVQDLIQFMQDNNMSPQDQRQQLLDLQAKQQAILGNMQQSGDRGNIFKRLGPPLGSPTSSGGGRGGRGRGGGKGGKRSHGGEARFSDRTVTMTRDHSPPYSRRDRQRYSPSPDRDYRRGGGGPSDLDYRRDNRPQDYRDSHRGGGGQHRQQQQEEPLSQQETTTVKMLMQLSDMLNTHMTQQKEFLHKQRPGPGPTPLVGPGGGGGSGGGGGGGGGYGRDMRYGGDGPGYSDNRGDYDARQPQDKRMRTDDYGPPSLSQGMPQQQQQSNMGGGYGRSSSFYDRHEEYGKYMSGAQGGGHGGQSQGFMAQGGGGAGYSSAPGAIGGGYGRMNTAPGRRPGGGGGMGDYMGGY